MCKIKKQKNAKNDKKKQWASLLYFIFYRITKKREATCGPNKYVLPQYYSNTRSNAGLRKHTAQYHKTYAHSRPQPLTNLARLYQSPLVLVQRSSEELLQLGGGKAAGVRHHQFTRFRLLVATNLSRSCRAAGGWCRLAIAHKKTHLHVCFLLLLPFFKLLFLRCFMPVQYVP